ncbi:MAG: 50S ribosomal protein L3 [Nitrospirota bacterium]
MITGLMGQKLGMTQLFLDGGRAVPVTVIEAGPCRVSQVKTKERDGYAAVQLAFLELPDRKASKPARGHFAKANLPVFRHVREFPASNDTQVGSTITVSLFAKGELVDVTGVSKGKGFQGVMSGIIFMAVRDRMDRCFTGLPDRSAAVPRPRVSGKT